MPQSPEPIKIAFLGCGEAARTHARTIQRLDRSVRLHFASRDPDKAARFARAFRGSGTFASYEAALADPSLSAVVVTTPPDSHLEVTLEALAAGKNVIVEKPAFFEIADFAVVRAAARQADRRVFVAENYFYKPLRRRLAGLLGEGIVGEPLLLRLNAVKRQSVSGWRADPARTGGGGLFEGGIHWINLISNLGMKVQRVSGHRAGAVHGREGSGLEAGPGTEETLLVAIEFAGGMVGTVAFSWEVPSPLRGVRFSTIYGRGGSIWFESNGIFVVARGSRTRLFAEIRDLSGHRAMWIDFLHALRTGGEPDMSLDLAEQDVRLIREVYASLVI